MKNLKTLAMLFALAFSLTSCSDNRPETNQVQRMAKEAGGECKKFRQGYPPRGLRDG